MLGQGKSNNAYSFENVMMIEYEGRVVGMVSGYTSSEKAGFKKNILSQYPGGAVVQSKFHSMV